MAADQEAFDPRFDPAFQPGFRTAGSGGGAEAGSGATPRADPRDAEHPAVPPRTEAPTTLPPLGHPDPAPIPLAGNPWIRLLWIVAAVFSLGGIAAMAWSQTAQLDRESAAAALILPVVVAGVAPWFVLTGLAAGVGVAILAAVRWRPGR